MIKKNIGESMNSLLRLLTGLLLFVVLIKAEEVTKYGKDIELKEVTKISAILENPAEFDGKKVLVEGTILDVCPNRGCWLELSSDVENEKIRVKVNDGEIVFPVEAKGKNALVEGQVYSIKLESEHSCDHEEGETCGSDVNKKEVKTIYQIKGLGAVIK